MLQRCIRGFVGRNIAKQRLYKIRDDLFAQIRLGRVDHVMKLLGGDGLEEYGLSAHDESGNGVVHKAAMWGHTRLVKKLCQMGANLNAQNHKSKTAAQLAVERGWEQVAEYLIEEQKCEIEFYGRTLLHDASLNGMFGVVLALIYRGIKIDERDDETERTSLVEAARGGHVLVSKLLLEYGADPNLKDEKGRTALHYAATSGSEDLVKVLVNAGARFDIEDSDGHTAWRLALSTCQNRVQKFFLKCWRKSKVTPKKNKKNKEFPEEAKLAAINAARRGDLDTVREIVGKGSVNISEKSTGNTIFMGAAESGSKDVIDFCLHRGCDVNRTNYFGMFFMFFSCHLYSTETN
jgi:ankyrin repeat protein